MRDLKKGAQPLPTPDIGEATSCHIYQHFRKKWSSWSQRRIVLLDYINRHTNTPDFLFKVSTPQFNTPQLKLWAQGCWKILFLNIRNVQLLDFGSKWAFGRRFFFIKRTVRNVYQKGRYLSSLSIFKKFGLVQASYYLIDFNMPLLF